MENKVRFKLHKVKKHWITIAASSLAIGASLIGLGQVGADEVKPETTAVNSPENVVSDSNLETSASLITRTEVAPTSTVVENTSSAAVSTDTTPTNVATQPTETTATQPSNEADKKVETAQSSETTIADRGAEVSSETSDNVTTSQETPSQGGRFTSDEQGNWYYLDSEGHKLTGPQTIDSFNLYFHDNGIQAKGEKVTIDGKDYYYDKDNGRKVTKAGFVKDNRGLTYYLDEKGNKVLGLHEINGDLYYFRRGGAYKYTQLGDMWQDSINYIDGKIYYFGHDGRAIKNRFYQWGNYWYYFYADGSAATGAVQINGQQLYFDKNHGRQVKGAFAPDGHYYDENSGELVTNQTRTIKGVTYHFDENGNATKV